LKRVHSVTTGQQLLTSQIDSASDGIVARPSQPVDIAASQPANTNIEESHLANSDEINKTDETTRGKIFQGVKTSPEDQVYCWDPRQKRDKKMRSSHSNNKMFSSKLKHKQKRQKSIENNNTNEID
jgi:hypothetical protein